MSAPIDLTTRPPSTEQRATRIYRRLITVTLEVDAHPTNGAAVRQFLDDVTGSIAGVCQMATQRGVQASMSLSRQNRALGGGWINDEQIVLPGQH